MLSLEALEERIGYVFQDKKLLRRAVTHRSFAQEHNERLEFLGDSVLNCVIGYALFLRDKHFNEGELSRVRANLVCEKTLHEIALKIDVSSFLYMGEGEVKTGGAHRASILADAMEAIFGAVFREAGFDTAQRVILKLYDPILTGLTPEQILEKLLGDMDLVINDTVPTQFYCNCSRERVSKALIAVGRKELNEMIQEAKPVELKCHFCNSAYEFSTEDLKELLRKSK